jgi:hypothetical protein
MFDVGYATTFDQLETLRTKMLEFLQNERRDFQLAFDVSVVGMYKPLLHYTTSLIPAYKISPNKAE